MRMELSSASGQDPADVRSRLLDLFKSRALFFGNFTLASGKQSTYYINSKKAIFNAEALWLMGEVIYQMTRTMNLQALGGPEVGAIPIATAAAMRYHDHGRRLNDDNSVDAVLSHARSFRTNRHRTKRIRSVLPISVHLPTART